MKNLIIIFIALMTTNQSCSNNKIAQSENKINTMEEKTLASNEWFLTKMDSEEVNNKNTFIEFNTDELKFSGKSFCNSIFGRLVVSGQSKIELTNMGMTMMACSDMSKEKKFTSLLRNVKEYMVKDGILSFYNDEGDLILNFSTEKPTGVENENDGVYNHEKSPLNRLYDIWGLKEMNRKAISGDKGMMIEMNTKEMTFMGYGACNKIFGSIAGSKENELSFLNVGATRKFCPEIMEYENEFIKSLKLVKTYQIKNLHLLLFDKDQNLILDFIKMD